MTKLGPDDEPLADVEDVLKSWLSQADKMVGVNLAAQPPESRQTLVLKRLSSRIDSLRDAIGAVAEHEVGVARWAETDTRLGAVLRSSPVDVGPILAAGLWQAAALTDPDADQGVQAVDGMVESDDPSGEAADPHERRRRRDCYQLNVVCLSATVPAGFGAQTGLWAPIDSYESPFEVAYADHTALYVPRLDEDGLDRISKPAGKNRRRFDTAAHVGWAAEQMAELVEANGGSALILSATTRAGQEYARLLRTVAGGRWKVLSQWDGRAPRRIVADWRADTTSVMVGTRSLMTGVDAPGQTCTLVVVDRIPRAAGNVVDDARVEALGRPAGAGPLGRRPARLLRRRPHPPRAGGRPAGPRGQRRRDVRRARPATAEVQRRRLPGADPRLPDARIAALRHQDHRPGPGEAVAGRQPDQHRRRGGLDGGRSTWTGADGVTRRSLRRRLSEGRRR